jgi:serine/threonine-protein kinase
MHLRVLCEALQGLHYAHNLHDFDGTALGIVHRDATPQNLFVTYDGQVKVVDFGIAKALDSTVETSTGVLKGKPSYMAPEQIAGDVDPRADVFTAGVMIWEAVAGRRMWAKQTDVEILTHIIKGEVPSLKDAKPDAAPELLRIVEKALAKNRDERYASASDLQADLEKYLTDTKTDVPLREIGKIVAEVFAGERAQVKSTIEQHLAGIREGKEQLKLPSIRPPAPMSGESAEKTPVSTTGEQSMPSSVTGGKTPAGTEMPAQSLAPAPAANKMKTYAIIGAAGLAALVLILVLTKKKEEPITATPTPPPAASNVPGAGADVKIAAAPVPTGPGTHEVAVKAYPKNAVVSIDGVEVSNPVTRRCDHGASFTVHASMTGHVSQDRTLSCD